MKKILISSFLCITILLTSAAGAFGEVNILEANDLKIVIDGQLAEFHDIPIYVGQNTLLPLRELLVKLGVPNDDEHIVWNGAEKSVTVYEDDIKIYLKVNSKTAYINDVPHELPIAPVGYAKNQRNYIPARFVCEALGKKVVWDSYSNNIYIKDVAKYAEIENILTKTDLAMKGLKKYKQSLNMDISADQNGLSVKFGFSMAGEIDKEHQRMHTNMNMDMLFMAIKSDSYYADNVVYTYEPYSGEWNKKTYSATEYGHLFTKESDMGLSGIDEVLFAQLELKENDKPDEILLVGNTDYEKLFDEIMESNESSSEIIGDNENSEYAMENYLMEIRLDSQTYLFKSLTMSANAIDTENQSKMDISVKIEYSDYDGSFEITIPDEVKNTAIESSESNSSGGVW